MNQDRQNEQTDQRHTAHVATDTRQEAVARASRTPHGSEREYHLQGAPEGLGTLVNGVITDVQDIVRNEVRLAQAELKEDVGTLGRAAAMGIAGAVTGLVGSILLMIGASILLAQWMADWLAFVIGGLALLVIAGALAMTAKNRVSAAKLEPERTIDSLQEDKAWAQEQAQSLKEDQA